MNGHSSNVRNGINGGGVGGVRRRHHHHHHHRSAKQYHHEYGRRQSLWGIVVQAILVWFAGVVLIEMYFFYSSIRILDGELLRGRGPGGDPMFDFDYDNPDGEEERRPPRPREPPPPKASLLPKRVITVVGPESSGTTFLATTLGIAAGAFSEDGAWVHTPAWAFSHVVEDEHEDRGRWGRDDDGSGGRSGGRSSRVRRQYHPKGRWIYERDVGRRAMSSDGEWEIQHLSLPWGWLCEEVDDISVVEALAPEECMRYEVAPHLHPKLAEKLFYSTKPEKHRHHSKSNDAAGDDLATLSRVGGGDAGKEKDDTPEGGGGEEHDETPEEAAIRARCRDEAGISEEDAASEEDGEDGRRACGAACGRGRYGGYALYPQRFFVNITSHIEWYLSRGVDVRVVMSIRDRTISSKSKLNGHCHVPDVGRAEDEMALRLMSEAMEKYGASGSRRGSLLEDAVGEERVIAVSYEGMMQMREAYLHDLYRRLGIASTYVPSFYDGNKKYVTNSTHVHHVHGSNKESVRHPPKTKEHHHPPRKKALLPKRVVAVFGPESSGTKFLSSALGVATGAFPSEGLWSRVPVPNGGSPEWVFHEHNHRRATSSDGEWEVQHLSLPWGWICREEDAGVPTEVVDAFVPAECFRYEGRPELSAETAERIRDGEGESKLEVSKWRQREQQRDRPHAERKGSDQISHQTRRKGEQHQHNDRPHFFQNWAKHAKGVHEHNHIASHWRRKNDAPGRSPAEADAANNGNDRGRTDLRGAELAIAERCRNEVGIAAGGTPRTCGAKCGSERYDGYALYPNRFFVNITSHIDWYESRGVEVTALLSMRDHSISEQSKLREHCSMPEKAEEEDALAVSLMKEAMQKHNKRGSEGRSRVITVSYEGLMQFKDVYLLSLYKQLGINSSYIPTFEDGNKKYIKDAALVRGDMGSKWRDRQKRKKPKTSLLPKKVVTVFGPESSGTTFLSTTLGEAIGNIFYDGEKRRTIARQAMSLDGEWEIQHLSLPWGWECEEDKDIHLVEALVPEECFRYKRDPKIESRQAAKIFYEKKKSKKARQHHYPMKQLLDPEEEANFLSMCREEVKISEENDDWTCGAFCGEGKYNGFALYPQRFSVNITSHIEWYLSRGVDIKVVVSMRDRTISSKSKLKNHCHKADVGIREDEVALSIMAEAYEKYGKYGSRLGSLPGGANGEERVIPVSYEGMMEMQEVYLQDLYRQLGINSTYVPNFDDGNEKYVTHANVANLGKQELKHQQKDQKIEFDSRPLKPANYQPSPLRGSLLPKKLITVVGSTFLSTTLAVAAGAFPTEGRWIERVEAPNMDAGSIGGKLKNPHELMFEDSITRGATASNNDWGIQHISLPLGWKCDRTEELPDIVDALVPERCFCLTTPEDPKVLEQCRNEGHIAEGSTSWTCGGKCGRGQSNGCVLHPKSYFVNITSHIEWWLARGVDVTVVLPMRDRTISTKEMLEDDCSMLMRAEKENEQAQVSVNHVSQGATARKIVKHINQINQTELEMKKKARVSVKLVKQGALTIKKEAYKKYGKHGSLLKSGDKERVIAVSYEGLLALKEVYLFKLYHQLGINSTYLPVFIDRNAKYMKSDHTFGEDGTMDHKKGHHEKHKKRSNKPEDKLRFHKHKKQSNTPKDKLRFLPWSK